MWVNTSFNKEKSNSLFPSKMMLKLFILGTILILPSFCDALFGNVFQGIGGAIENTLLGGSSAIKDAIFGNCNPAFCKEVGSIYSTCSHSSNSSQKIINAVDLISSNMVSINYIYFLHIYNQ